MQAEFLEVLHQTQIDPAIRALVLISGKPGSFIAGADIRSVDFVYVWVCVCVSVCVCVWGWVSVQVCMYKCVGVCVGRYGCVCLDVYECVLYSFTSGCSVCRLTLWFMHTRTRAYKHSCITTHAHIHMQAHPHTHNTPHHTTPHTTHTHTHTHTRARMYTHTHTQALQVYTQACCGGVGGGDWLTVQLRWTQRDR